MAATQADRTFSYAAMPAAYAVVGAVLRAARLVCRASFGAAIGHGTGVRLAVGRRGCGQRACPVGRAGERAGNRGLPLGGQPGQRQWRLSALQGLDAAHRVVDVLRRLVPRVVGHPRLPAGLLLRQRDARFEVGRVAALEVAVAVMDEAVARDARRPQDEQAQGRERHAHVD